jgi:hypothetical protein
MAIKDSLDATFAVNVTAQSVIMFQREIRRVKGEVDASLVTLGGISLDPKTKFDTVDPEIVAEAAALTQILTDCKAALEGHVDFIEWKEAV